MEGEPEGLTVAFRRSSYIIERVNGIDKGFRPLPFHCVLEVSTFSRVVLMNENSQKSGPPRIPRTVMLLIFAVLIIAVGAIYLSKRQVGSEEPVDTTTGSGELDLSQLTGETVEYTLGITHIVEGTSESEMETLEIPVTNAKIQLNIDVIFDRETGLRYGILVEEYKGEKLYAVWIPEHYMNQGVIPLNLDGKIFGPGKYRIEVSGVDPDSVAVPVAEGLFDITE